jgi:gliding motility-associated-like protein
MNKIYVLCLALLMVQVAFTQNANFQVRITKLERTGYSDCGLCGQPDPTWKVQSTHNGSGAQVYGPNCWHFPDMTFTLWDIADFNLMNVVNSNATTITMGMNDAFEKSCSNNNCTYEPYNFFTCFPSVNGDDRRCQNTNLNTIPFKTFAPCTWHTAWSNWCGDYRFEYSFYWSFNYAPTLITQPVASANLCLGDSIPLVVAAGNDPNGWNMGVNFQWQVSTQTACPGVVWTDITGAVNDTFFPPQTPGTRLYRCKVTSNCNPDFSSNTTISSCSRITYNPMGSPGDPAPAVVSGICGSVVLPGTSHNLSVLSAPSPGAALGMTDFSWAATGGSPQTAFGSQYTWTAPVVPGTYTIQLTYIDNCPQPDATAPVCVVTVGSPTCDFAYVATSGVDSVYAGGPDLPYKSLAYALTQLSGRKYIRMAHGLYNETVPLLLQDSLIIEGGYRITGNIWSKVNNVDSTVILCTGTEIVSNTIAHRVGFKSDGADNWRLQDLRIQTTNISQITPGGPGYSNYGILAINGSSNFEVVRCKVLVGNAAKGLNGSTPAGAGGAGGGGNGGAGGNWSNQECNGCGQVGNGGVPGNGGAAPGAGGNTCCGSGCNFLGCNASGCTAGNGTAGAAGAAGAGFTAGDKPATPPTADPFYTPAGQSATASNGFGGGGGGGGGGGDWGSDCFCSQGGNALGGNGGNGGNGGLPGSGGFGGGGSFGIYAAGAQTSGVVITAQVVPGNAGLGGDGAAGQPGAVGQNGANGNTNSGSCNPPGRGGNGGNGGNGGAGGRGRDGADGLSLAIATAAGATVSGTSSTVPNPFTVGVNVQNAKLCNNSEIELTKSSGVWSFPSGLSIVNNLRDQPAGLPVSSYNFSSSPIVVTASQPGAELDVVVNGTNYAQYITLAADNRALPVISVSSPAICINGSTTLNATHWGTEVEFDWIVYQGTNAANPLFQSTLPSPLVDLTGYTTGTYVVRYRVRELCCGWSKPVFATIQIVSEPQVFNVFGGGFYCPGTNGSVISLSGSEPGVTYVLLYNGQPVDTVSGIGGPIQFDPQTAIGNYTVVATLFSGCSSDMFGFASVGQYPLPVAYTVSGSDTICQQGTSSLSATIQLSGSEIGTNYQLIRDNNIPVGAPLPGTGLVLPFTGITQPGTYRVLAVSPQTGCQQFMLDSAVISLAPIPASFLVGGGGGYCVGDSGSVITLSGSETGVSYELLLAGVLPSVPAVAGTGSPIAFAPVTAAGYYKVRAVTSVGCTLWMTDSVFVTVRSLPVITGVTVNSVSCNGQNDGSISITATSSNGAVAYSVNNGTSFFVNGTFSNLAAGTYAVAVRDNAGCETFYVANPVVVTQPTAVQVNIEHIDSIYCNGTNNGAIQISVYGGSPGYTFSWSNGNSFEDISQLTAGTYSVTVTDTRNCTGTLSVALPEPVSPVTAVTIPVNVRCFGGQNGSVTIQATGGTPPYKYYLNGVYQSSNVFTGLTAGTYTAVVEDANDCVSSALFTLTQPQQFFVSAGEDVLIGSGQPITLNATANSGSGILGYMWTPDLDLSCVDCANPIAAPDSTREYVVMVTDGDSCVAFDSVIVRVNRAYEAFFPTAFTPNGDGLNDYFSFDVLGLQAAEVRIFDRWGKEVYYNPAQPNGTAVTNAWDGRDNNKLAAYDTYVYQIKLSFYNGETRDVSGTVTLMR